MYKAYFDAATLFQAYRGHKPDLESLRIFGCAAYSVNIHGHSLTYDPKILDKHILIGIKRNRIWRLLNRHTKKELLTTDVKFNEYLFPKLTDVTDEAVVPVPVPQNTRPSKPAPAPTTRSLPDQQGTRPGNTESRDIQLHKADEQEALPSTTGSRNDRLSSSRNGWLSSTARGSGAETRPDMAFRPADSTIFRPTRSGRVPKQTVFSDSVMQLVTGLNAAHLKESSSVQVLILPFEAITIKEAIKENAPE